MRLNQPLFSSVFPTNSANARIRISTWYFVDIRLPERLRANIIAYRRGIMGKNGQSLILWLSSSFYSFQRSLERLANIRRVYHHLCSTVLANKLSTSATVCPSRTVFRFICNFCPANKRGAGGGGQCCVLGI